MALMTTQAETRRRFTIIEVAVIAAIAALLLAIVVPVALNKATNQAQVDDVSAVQAAVRDYAAQFNSYPTFGPALGDGQSATAPWTAGQLPAEGSVPKHAGIDFSASALRAGQQNRVRFSPDVLSALPRHAGEVAADGTQRWRIDHNGTISVEMDGRSF